MDEADRSTTDPVRHLYHVICLHPSTQLRHQLQNDWWMYPNIGLQCFSQAKEALQYSTKLNKQQQSIAVLIIADQLPDQLTSDFLQQFQIGSPNTQTILLGDDLSVQELSLIINASHVLHHFTDSESLDNLHEKLQTGLLCHALLASHHGYEALQETNNLTEDIRILAVDDDPVHLKLLQNYVESVNYQVVTATSAEQAWQQLQDNPPFHAVLLDVVMPGENGFQLTQRIRQKWQLHQLPVLLVSVQDNVDARVQGFIAGANDYISKPIEYREFTARLQTHLSLRRLKQDVAHHQHVESLLRQAKEQAEAASHAKSQFLANMSHELRTPLNGILGYAQLLEQEEGLSNKQQSAVQIIYRSGEHLLTLINDVLDLAKIEAGKLELQLDECHLPVLLNDITELFSLRAKQKGLLFSLDLPPIDAEKGLPPIIEADAKRLRQILLNLLSNAVNYTSQGEVKLRVMREESVLHFSVEDTGIGIAADKIEQIFLPFQQLQHTQKNNDGTGLGLAITKVLVEMMEGQLYVNSHLGVGSVFRFAIPCNVLSQNTSALDLKPTTPKKIVTYRANHQDKSLFSILVADDRWENRALLLHLLVPLGFEVVEAQDGQDVLDKARHAADLGKAPDVILMDLRMPKLDGLHCTRLLRTDARFEATQIIAISASISPQTRINSFAEGCNAFIGKPINTQELLDVLSSLCEFEWLYTINADNLANSAIQEEEVIQQVPEQAQLSTLLELAEAGDIEGVLGKVSGLHNDQPELHDFVHTITTLAQNFETRKLKNLLRSWIEY